MPEQSSADESDRPGWWWRFGPLILAGAMAVVAAAWQYRAATVPTPQSSFDGAVWVTMADSGERSENQTAAVQMQVLSSPPTHDQQVSVLRITVSDMSPRLAGTVVDLQIIGDAMPADPQITAHLPDTLGVAEDRLVHMSLTGPSGHVRIPVAHDASATLITMVWRMRRPVARVGGNVVALSYPKCLVLSLGRSCVVDGGAVAAGQVVTYAQPPLSGPNSLRWQSNRPLDGPQALLTDDQLSRFRDTHLFTAGALVGVAGGVVVELLSRLSPPRRRRPPPRSIGAANRQPGPVRPPPPPVPTGERWAAWKRQVARKGRPSSD